MFEINKETIRKANESVERRIIYFLAGLMLHIIYLRWYWTPVDIDVDKRTLSSEYFHCSRIF